MIATDQSDLARFSTIELMIGNMYGEARSQEGDLSDDVREWLAIGCVVMNRAKSEFFPSTPKDVILQHKQFSWTNPGDPSRRRVIDFLTLKNTPLYLKMKMYATKILEGKTIDFSNGADHYVAAWLYEREKKQKWIDEMTITAVYGGHIFLKKI